MIKFYFFLNTNKILLRVAGKNRVGQLTGNKHILFWPDDHMKQYRAHGSEVMFDWSLLSEGVLVWFIQ